jgi:hypothetical protein
MSTHNRKFLQRRADGYHALRIFARKGRGEKSPRLLIKCGDCENALEIYYDSKYPEDLEIGGVLGSVENWREILLPMLDAQTPLHLQPRSRPDRLTNIKQ